MPKGLKPAAAQPFRPVPYGSNPYVRCCTLSRRHPERVDGQKPKLSFNTGKSIRKVIAPFCVVDLGAEAPERDLILHYDWLRHEHAHPP